MLWTQCEVYELFQTLCDILDVMGAILIVLDLTDAWDVSKSSGRKLSRSEAMTFS